MKYVSHTGYLAHRNSSDKPRGRMWHKNGTIKALRNRGEVQYYRHNHDARVLTLKLFGRRVYDYMDETKLPNLTNNVIYIWLL